MLKGNVKYLLDASYMNNNRIIIIVSQFPNLVFGTVSLNFARIRKNVRI